jgi:predicted RNase H-like HicB family nuclease
MKPYVVLLEPTPTGYSAYAPDLAGCIAAGGTFEETESLMREAIAEHVQLLRERGQQVPSPATHTAMAEVV